MTVIARDAVASDHLVYAWPFPIGPECEVTCADDEQVVMCPAWNVGDRLGPGRHLWRTPDPSRPVAAFFVLVGPVEVSFDLITMFLIPATGQPIRVRAVGALQVRCVDPGLLVAQFVGLPFDRVNDGILRSVARSVERMLARLLIRRVVLSGSPYAVTDPSMLPGIVEELVAYNPTAGAVFGIELIRMGHLTIVADDGSSPYLTVPHDDRMDGHRRMPTNGDHGAAIAAAQQIAQRVGDVSLVETARGRPGSGSGVDHALPRVPQSSPEIVPPPLPSVVSGEIGGNRPPSHHDGVQTRRGHAVEMPHSTEDITQPGVHTPVPGSIMHAAAGTGQHRPASPSPQAEEHRGSILGVGMSPIGASPTSVASGEIAPRIAPGERVLVPGPNGLMQSATVRQLLQGYYELEVGSSGLTIWVPIDHVVPEHH